MQVTRQDLNACTVSLNVVCDKEQVEQGFLKATKQISKTIKMPGFRPGHVPKGMIEKMIDPQHLNEEAAEQIVRAAFRQAMEQEKIQPDPGTAPAVELVKLDREEGACEFNAKVPLPPVVEIGDYKGLPVEKEAVEVTEEEVEYQIEELRKQRHSREAVTDRGAEEGDVAVVNIKLEGEEGDGRNFMTVVGKTFPQLDQALSGMKVEEMKNLDLTFPENFQEKDWAGKPYKCLVTLNSISAVKLPAIDDAFAQSLKTENLDDLKTKLREGIMRAKNDMVREMVTDQLLERLQERSKVQVSDNMWEQLANRRLRETEQEVHEQGKTMETHAAENGMTVEAFVEAWREKAKTQVIRALLIRTVFEKEKLSITNEDLNRELYAMASEFGVEPQQMLEMLQKNNAMEEVQYRSISRKVSEFLLQNADIKEVALAGA
ncbi:MAG TPA: trigger factor [Fimbriimonadaceae bacterium]|nr:trigger factor [Fimbriimonadaceae bacterium]